jgi:hypothetical protein
LLAGLFGSMTLKGFWLMTALRTLTSLGIMPT